jgi:hypothetical protein
VSLEAIRTGLVTQFPQQLVDQLLECYQEQRANYFLGKHRPTEVEGGRFSEAAFRMLESYCSLPLTPIGTQINTEGLIKTLANLPANTFNESVRLHVPRMLRVVYDIRNKRDAAHLADGIDANLQDATFVFSALDWVLAEFIRLSTSITPEQAVKLIKGVTVNVTPSIEEFDGFLKTLNPSLGPGDRILILLYQRNSLGASIVELTGWLKPSQRTNIKRSLSQLEHDKDFVVLVGGNYKITRRGILHIQNKKLLEL